MRVAVIGLGSVGQVHVKVIQELQSDLVAVCDIDEDKHSVYKGIKCYTDYLNMLDEQNPDVVHICTPHYLHTEMIVESLRRNINVLCEKPLCIKEEDIPLILTAEQNSKAQLGVCFQNRYSPVNIAVKNILEKDKPIASHGRLVWGRGVEYYTQDDWHGTIAREGGGVLINQAIHTLDLLQWFCGMPKALSAFCGNLSLKGAIEVEDTASIICSGDSKFTFFATNGGCCDFPVSINIKTDKESISVLKGKVVTANAVYDFEKDNTVYGKCCYGTGHLGLMRDFYDCVKSGRKFEIDGYEASKVIKIILATYKSKGDKIDI